MKYPASPNRAGIGLRSMLVRKYNLDDEVAS